MTSSPIRFLSNLTSNRPRIYLSDLSNFILILHKRAEIYSREVNRELSKKWALRHCDLDLWPKVTNFNRVPASSISNHLEKTASKSVHPFSWNFVYKQSPTHTHTHRQTDCSENVTPPQFRGSVKNKKHSENEDTSTSVTFNLDVWFWPYLKVKKAYVMRCRLSILWRCKNHCINIRGCIPYSFIRVL